MPTTLPESPITDIEAFTTTRGIDRRLHRRLDLELPLRLDATRSGESFTAMTQNISTGGLYFEHGGTRLLPGNMIEFSLTIPASEGVWPYQGRVRGAARVLRCDSLRGDRADNSTIHGVAVQFVERLRFTL